MGPIKQSKAQIFKDISMYYATIADFSYRSKVKTKEVKGKSSLQAIW